MRPGVLYRMLILASLATVANEGCTDGGGYSMRTTYKECVVNLLQDGPAMTARFGSISGLATNSSGSIIVGDYFNGRIRSISPDGQVTTLAELAKSGPEPLVDLTVDASGSIYFLNNAFICRLTQGGETTTVAGSDNPFTGGFWQPWGLAMDASGNVIVADSRHNRIKSVTPEGIVSEIAGSGGIDLAPISPGGGFSDGPAASAMFYRPASVACDANGNIYVSDKSNNRIRKISPDQTVTTLAGSGTKGSQDGPGSSAQFSDPSDIAATADGTVYVIDLGSNTVRCITPNGLVSTLPSFNQTGANPTRVAVDASGSVYISIYTDQGNARGGQVLKYVPGGSYQLVAGDLGACDWQTRVAE